MSSSCSSSSSFCVLRDRPKSSSSSWSTWKFNDFRWRVGGSNLGYAILFISTLVFFFRSEDCEKFLSLTDKKERHLTCVNTLWWRSNQSGTCRMEVEFLPLAGFNKNRVDVAHGDGTNLEVVSSSTPAECLRTDAGGTRSNARKRCVKPGLQYTRACLQYTRRTTSHHAAPWRAVLRSTVRMKSHQFAPIEQCSIFCARPRDFAAARLRLQAKLSLFNVLGQKGLSKTLVQTNGFCYPSSSSFFCTSFVVLLMKTALLFFK